MDTADLIRKDRFCVTLKLWDDGVIHSRYWWLVAKRAIEREEYEIARILINANGVSDKEVFDVLMFAAAKMGNQNLITRLLKEWNDYYSLLAGLVAGDHERLYKEMKEIHYCRRAELEGAVRSNEPEILAHYLKEGDINVDLLFRIAFEHNKREIVDFLIERYGDPEPNTMLFSKSPVEVEDALVIGADQLERAVTCAAKHGRYDVIRTLVRYGAKVTDEHKKIAAKFGYEEMAKMM